MHQVHNTHYVISTYMFNGCMYQRHGNLVHCFFIVQEKRFLVGMAVHGLNFYNTVFQLFQDKTTLNYFTPFELTLFSLQWEAICSGCVTLNNNLAEQIDIS